VGDRITFQGHYGDIISIGLRSVKLLTLDESIVTIPNNRFLTNSVSSSSAGDLGMMITIDIHVSPKTDVYLAKKILQEQAEKNQYIDGQKKIIIVCKEILNISGTVSFVMTIKCILKDTRQEKAFQTDFILKVNKEFKKNNIE
jgi:small-conductance mechanosensitive channel